MIQKLIPLIVGVVAGAAFGLPEVVVDRPGVRLEQSSRIVIEPGTVLEDTDGRGVIRIAASDITVEFAEGSVLRGAPEGAPWDGLTGTGVRLDGHTNVTLRGFKVHGFRVGVHASGADGLVFEDADLSDNYRKRLGSTPVREDSRDWMSPHRNDNNEWIRRYGGALYIQNAEDVIVRRVYVRRGQNGILFSEVNNSRIYDNDASFLTGWGIGLWRSSNNVISRNAVDFCVRGHVEGVYNRGQDSAGILFFEQCNENIVAENSATHGGDGFFAYGGREALGQTTPREPGFDHTRKGCNDNLFIENDFSYAPAHGWEMTFSFGNKFVRNRVVENAICGIWGGYSQQTLIAENYFDGNGGMPYGLERGGVNIEHSKDNVIVNNTFVNNRAGVHIWWRPPGYAALPWGDANYGGVVNNVIAGNRFVINDEPRPFVNFRDEERVVVLHLRDYEEGNVRETHFFDNELELTGERAQLFNVKEGIGVIESGTMPEYTIPDDYPVYGQTRPIGERKHLRGRHMIIMDEWGPWDHKGPLVRVHEQTGESHAYDVFGVPGTLDVSAAEGEVTVEPGPLEDSHHVRITGTGSYNVRVSSGDFSHEFSGTIEPDAE